MEEREKFEKWLSDLEAKKATTPEHVFDRVKADYSLRLDKVLDKLRDHTSALRQHSQVLAKKLEELETEEQNLRDEKAEHALRAEVGELDESEWESYSRKTEKTIAKLQEDQEVASSDLERIRDLLGSLDGAPKAAAAAPAKKNVDELEFLKSVVGTTPHGGAARPAAPAKGEAKKPEPVKAEAPAPAAPPAPPAAARPTPASPPPAAQPESIISKPVTGPDLTSRGNQSTRDNTGPLSLKSTGSQDIPKTLKCAECGAMNYPSEWYCERCGAELVNI